MMSRFGGLPRTALVTGASSGIGEATARLLAGRGFRVFGTSRRELPDAAGVEMLTLDVRSEDSVRSCVADVLARANHLDVLVNNAGIMHEGFAEETMRGEAEEVFATNFFGVVRVIDAVLPGMRERRQGCIINVGSLAAWVGEPGEAFYSASKAALLRYSESLRHEVWPLGIAVSLVEPGPFRTDVVRAALTSADTIADYDGLREPARRTMHRSLQAGDDPSKAAATVAKIALARSPVLRYGTGPERWVPRGTALMPQRLLDRLLRRSFGLPGPAKARAQEHQSRRGPE